MHEERKGPCVIQLKVVSSDEVEVVLRGSLSRDDMNEFQAWLDKALQGGHRIIALNFAELTTLSSSAIGKILHFKRTCDERGCKLVVRHCSAEMLLLLKMIKFDSLIQIESETG
jgi:anti-anti-sigma factor